MLTRRTLLISGAAAAGVAAIGAAAAWALRGGEDKPSSVTVPGGQTPTTGGDSRTGLDLIEPVDNAFERRTFAPGEPIDWPHGIFFMNVDSGEVDGWRLTAPSAGVVPEDVARGYTLPTPSFIECSAGEQRLSYLVDRQNGRAWAYSTNRLRAVTGSHQVIVFEELEPSGPGWVGTGRFHATGNELTRLSSFNATPPTSPQDPLMSPDGSLLAGVTVERSEPSLVLFDLRSGEQLQKAVLPGPLPLNVVWHTELNASADMAADVPAPDGTILRVRLPWRDEWPDSIQEGPADARPVHYSPAGRYALAETRLRTGESSV